MLGKWKWNLIVVIAIMVCFTTACGNKSQNASTNGIAPKTKSISGTLNFYTSEPIADANKVVAAFNKKYPDVKVKTYRSGTEQVVSKIEAEKQSGGVQADVAMLADAVTFNKLKSQNLLYDYASPELSQIPKQYVDKDHAFSGTKVLATALVVNTNKAGSLPNSWSVLTSGAAKGKTIMPSPLYSGAAAYNLGVLTRQSGFGWNFYKQLKNNGIMVTKGNGSVLKDVANGQKSYGMVVAFIVARAEAKGSPVKLVYPKEGVPVITEPVGIMKNTENLPAAKAFEDFVLSQDGQKLFAGMGYVPVRKGVQPPKGLKGVADLKVIGASIDTLYKNQEQDKQKFTQIFGQ